MFKLSIAIIKTRFSYT